jgi:serine/threonine protein kinase
METGIRGYLLNQPAYNCDFFTVYNAEHSILKGQNLRITVIADEFAKDSDIRSAFNQSAFRLSFIEHNHIIKNTDMIEENGLLAILSEYGVYKDINSYLVKVGVDEYVSLFENILDAVEYLVSRSIYIIDLRPENLLVDDSGIVKIANTGIANILLKTNNPETLNKLDATLLFTAPEVRKKEHGPGEKSVIYTCATLFKYLFGLQNVEFNSDAESFEMVPEYLRDVISKGVNQNPNLRYTGFKEFKTEFSRRMYANATPCENVEMEFKSPASNPVYEVRTENYVNPPTGKLKEKVEKVIEIKPPKIEPQQEPQKQPTEGTNKSLNYYDLLKEIELEKVQKAAQQQQAQQKQKHHRPTSQNNVNNFAPEKGFHNENKTGNNSSYNQPSKGQSVQNNQPDRPRVNPRVNSQPKVNTTNVLALGIIGIVFSFILPFVGFVLAIIGFAQVPKNKRKVRALNREFLSSEKSSQTIGTLLCVLALVISIIRMVLFVIRLF